MGIHLPDEVATVLRDEGLSADEAMLMTGDELRQVIGGGLTYELAVALAGQRLTIARRPGERARLPEGDLIERNLDILKLRLVDGLNFAQIGREVGLTNSRVSEILRIYYGVDLRDSSRPARERTLFVRADQVAVLRSAFLGLLDTKASDLVSTLRAGDDDWYAAWARTQDVVNLLLEVQKDKDVRLKVGGRRSLITKALRDHADLRRSMDRGEDDAEVCDRLLAAT